MASPQDEQLKVYEQLCNSYRAIDDFRAKLLGFLPLATGTGVFLLLTDQAKIISMSQLFKPIGIFGVVVTLGLFFYELYGIKKCTSLIKAGRELEKHVLNVKNGQFATRPLGVLGFINEPFAASLIYPAVLAAWTFLAFAFPEFLPPREPEDTSPLKFQNDAYFWALRVFLAGFAGAFCYNLYLIREDIRNVITWLKTKLQSAATPVVKRKD